MFRTVLKNIIGLLFAHKRIQPFLREIVIQILDNEPQSLSIKTGSSQDD